MVDLLERAGRVLIENPPVETTTVEVLRGQLRRRRRQQVALGMIPVLVAGALLTVALVRRSGTARSITPAGTAQTIDDGSTPGERPLRGTPIEVTGYHIGDTAGLSTVFPDDWFTEDSELVEELLPEWIAVLDDERVVLGYVKGIEFVTPVHDPLPIYGENGEVIGDYDEFGRPALDLMTPSDGIQTDPVGDGSTICVAGTYTIADGDIPKKVADKFKVSIAWLDYVNADTTGYDVFYVGLVIKIPSACGERPRPPDDLLLIELAPGEQTIVLDGTINGYPIQIVRLARSFCVASSGSTCAAVETGSLDVTSANGGGGSRHSADGAAVYWHYALYPTGIEVAFLDDNGDPTCTLQSASIAPIADATLWWCESPSPIDTRWLKLTIGDDVYWMPSFGSRE